MLAIVDQWLRAGLEENSTLRRAENSHSLYPDSHQGEFYSVSNIQTGIKTLVRKGRLSDMMVNCGVMENHIQG